LPSVVFLLLAEFRDTGRFGQAQEHYDAAEKAWRSAFRLKESAEYQNGLFSLFNDHVAELREKQKDDTGQLRAYQDALDAERKAVALAPKEGDYRVREALALWNIGKLQSDNRQALETFRLAVETLREGVVLFPEGEGNSAPRANAQTGFYVILHNHIAPILHSRNDASGEFSALKEALAGAQAAVDLEKRNATYQANLGQAHLGIGDFLRQESADKTRALESYAHAEKAFRVATQINPTEAGYWSSLADACNRQGLIQDEKGESLAARASYQNALDAIEQAGKLNPDASTRQLHDDISKKLGPGK
jgi:tetratricopeptide (TPR) repeat protein